MSIGVVVSVLLGSAAAVYVLAPLFRNDAALSEYREAATSELVELRSRQEMVLASLKDLEDDRSTGKIGDADHAELEASLTAQAVDLMKRIDALEKRAPGAPTLVPSPEK
jgi:hypothetical protein